MRSPHEGPTASRFSLRIPRGPRKFVAASLAFDILSRDCFREEIPFHGKLQAYSLPDIASSFLRQRGLPAGGAYWPEGPTGLRGRLWPRWPPPWLRPCLSNPSIHSGVPNYLPRTYQRYIQGHSGAHAYCLLMGGGRHKFATG